jgi:hypothetical protein
MLVGAVLAVAAATYRQWRAKASSVGIAELSDYGPMTDDDFTILESHYLLPQNNKPRPYSATHS